jgi:hypothetical protein
VYTIIETPTFTKLAANYWTEEEHGEFATFIAVNFDKGDVIPGSGGLRKIRWSRKGSGKRGGIRIIYYNRLNQGEIWLLLIYAKKAQENIPAHILKAIRTEIEND